MRFGLYTAATEEKGITISLPTGSLKFSDYKVFEITDFEPLAKGSPAGRLDPGVAFTACG